MERAAPNTFQRKESNFLISQNQVDEFDVAIIDLIVKIGLEEEHYQFNTNRTVYFSPTNNCKLSGLSIRYRDYASGPLDQVGINSGTEGALEIKCSDDSKSKGKRKLKIKIPFSPEITISMLRKLIEQTDLSEKKKSWFLDKLNSQHLDDDHPIVPISAVSYQRRRFHRGENVFNVDSNLVFFRVDSIANQTVFIRTGVQEGLVCELKEETDDVTMRWQVYRCLVKNKTSWAKSKRTNSIASTKAVNSRNPINS